MVALFRKKGYYCFQIDAWLPLFVVLSLVTTILSLNHGCHCIQAWFLFLDTKAWLPLFEDWTMVALLTDWSMVAIVYRLEHGCLFVKSRVATIYKLKHSCHFLNIKTWLPLFVAQLSIIYTMVTLFVDQSMAATVCRQEQGCHCM